jgi:hypothetical protein
VKLNPDTHKGMHSVLALKLGVTPKAFRSNMPYTCFLKCFWMSNNIIKCDGKTNPIIWLKDYRFACKVGRVDDDLFIIQFLLIYLDDTTRA